MSEFEYRIKFVFQEPVDPEVKRDLSDLCSRLIGGNLKLISVRTKLSRALTYFYLVIIGVLGVCFLDYLDRIVNVQLYEHGLTFSQDWYRPFFYFEKSIYVFLGLIMLIGIVYFVFSLRQVRLIWKHRKLIRTYKPIFIEDTDRGFTKFHTVQIYLQNKKRKKAKN